MKQQNLMLMTPYRNPNIYWEKSDKIVLKLKRESKIDKFVNKLFKTPLVLKIQLDELGSFVWENCDGIKCISDIADEMEKEFGEKANPVVDRLVEYIRILINNKFIRLE